MKWKTAGAVIITVICALFLYLKQDYLFVSPNEEPVFQNIVYVTQDRQGNMLVLDSSGERLRMVDGSNTLQWTVCGSAESFQEAKRVVVNDEGRIFVQGLVKEEENFRLKCERVLEYTMTGELVGIVAEHTYEEPILSPHIAGLFPTEEGAVYAYKNEHSLALYNQEGALVKECELENAQYLPSVAWNESTGEVYYSTYSGLVCRYLDGRQDTVLYNAADADELSIPKEISLDEEQNLYLADIGLRDILRINAAGEVERFYEKVDLYDKRITYYLNADHGLISCTEDAIKQYHEGRYDYIHSFRMNGQQRADCVLLWIDIVVLGLVVAAWVVAFIRYLIKTASRFVRMATGIVLGFLGLAVILLGILIPQFENQILYGAISRAQMASEILIQNLPYEEFSRLDAPADFMGADYNAVKEAATNIFETENGSTRDLYCAFYKILNGMIVGTYCLQEDTGVIYPYPWKYEGSDEQEIIETRTEKVYANIQTSEGSYLLVLNPVIDDKGEVIGLLEVGADLKGFLKQEQEVSRNVVGIIGGITLICVAALQIFFQISILKPVRTLTRAAENLAEGRYGEPVVVKGNDEISDIAHVFNRMSLNIKNHMDEINAINEVYHKYVPSQFFELLSKESVIDTRLGDQKQCELSVMNFNVVAFDSLIRQMSSENMFAFINQILQHAIPEVVHNEGMVETFRDGGFTALYRDSCERALDSAVSISQKMNMLNRDQSFKTEESVRFSAGIAYGSVMLGVVGEDARMSALSISQQTAVAEFLQKIAPKYNAGILVTGSAAAQIDNFEGLYRARVLGYFLNTFTDKLEKLYDVYDGDQEEDRRRKDMTREMFEEGVRLFCARKFYEARTCFVEVLKQYRRDAAAREYLFLCNQYYQKKDAADVDIFVERF